MRKIVTYLTLPNTVTKLLTLTDYNIYMPNVGIKIDIPIEFMDLKNEYEIGEMELNHWKIYNGKYLDYRCTDTSFEVIYNQGYVVFHISFVDKACVYSINAGF